MRKTILVTGGAGYIGSHACVRLLEAGHDIVLIDNFSNSKPAVIPRIQALAGREFPVLPIDLRDMSAVTACFASHRIDAVIHFAGLKAVGESCRLPLHYYDNNLVGTLNLLRAMAAAQVWRLIFSSSATVYGLPETVPVAETAPLDATNPYGRTKLMIEQILGDCQQCGDPWQIALLRYFNPAGAHPSGQIGEDPDGIPNNLLPYITQVAAGQREHLPVFGADYDTADGTGVRDYIHVIDLVDGHIKALDKLFTLPDNTAFCRPYNLGTGKGYSVLDMIRTFEQVNQVKVDYRIMPRRPGDVAACWADPTRARTELDWQAQYDLDTMLADSWRWQRNNPRGYAD